MSIPYSNAGRTVNIHKIKGMNYHELKTNELCTKNADGVMEGTNVFATSGNLTTTGTISGGVTSVTELKTGRISPAAGQVTTTFPYDVQCRDMTVNSLTTATPNINPPRYGSLAAGTTTLTSLTTLIPGEPGTLNYGPITVGEISAGPTTVTSLHTSSGPITAGAISGTATSVTSLTSSGAITGGHTSVDSLTTQGGQITAGIAVVQSLDVRNPTYSPTNPLSYGYITGGVTTVTELVTDNIVAPTGSNQVTINNDCYVNTSGDVYCRDMNVNVKLVTDTIVAPNGSNEIAMNSYVRIPSGMSTGGIYTNTVHAPTTGSNLDLLLKGGNGWAANILIQPWNTYYRADKHYFYRRGNNFDNFVNHPSQGVFFNGNVYWQSDDRLKHNEEDITDALGTIRKLNAQKYQKTDEPKEADFNGELTGYYIEETGFIAQDVMEIPELTYCVTEGVTANGKDIYNLKYNDIFVVNVQAVKELDAIVQSQQTKIDSLEARLTALENIN